MENKDNEKDIILSPEQVAKYLQIHLQTVYRNLRQKRLPGNKVGRQWRIRKSDLDRFLAGSLGKQHEEG